MNFSTNQVMQFYCVGSAPTLKKFGKSGEETHAYLEVANAAGETVRTDLIQKGHVLDVKYVAAGDDKRPLRAKKVALVGSPVVGQEYIVRVLVRGTIGEECTYQKQASYVAKTGDTAGKVLAGLAGNLLVNLTEDYPIYELFDDSIDSDRANKLVAKVGGGKVKLYEADAPTTEVTSLTSLVIAEPIPAWKLGTFPEQNLNFEVTIAPIVDGDADVDDWATITDLAAGDAGWLVNTHRVADMEYFAEGEKGADDVHGFSIITDGNVALAVDPTDATGYNVLTCQYYHTGARDAVQKSERTLVIVAKSAVSLSTLATALKAW